MLSKTDSATPLVLVPPRTHICIDCRTMLREGENCDAGPRHRVVSLRSPEGREALLNEVWGPPSVRRRAMQLAKASGGGLTAGSFFEGCGLDACNGCSSADAFGEMIAVLAVILVVAAVAMLLYWVVAKIIEYVRKRRNMLKPHGALRRPSSLGRVRVVRGRVERAVGLAAPASGVRCAAYAMDLSTRRFLRGALMLHDVATAGFDVLLDDGRRVQVPAGRLRLEGRSERVDMGEALSAYLSEVDPKRGNQDDLDPIPFDEVRECRLREGDRVELFYQKLEAEADPGAGGGDYRMGAKMRFIPAGVAGIRIL